MGSGGYEYTVPTTFGHTGDGDFRIVSPWNTPCEACILAATFGKAGGGFNVNFDGSSINGMSVSETTAPNDGGARGLYLYNPTGVALSFGAVYFPFPERGAVGHWHPITTGEAGNITLVFRRDLSAFPEMPTTHYVNPDDEEQWHLEADRLRREAAGG